MRRKSAPSATFSPRMSNLQFVFKATALSLAGAILVGYGVGHLLADRWYVTTTHTLKADPERVAAALLDLSSWQHWYGAKVDLGNPTRAEVQGQVGTVGHTLVWSGPLGEARLRLAAIEPGAVAYDYGVRNKDGSTGGTGTGRVEYQKSPEGCSVSWTDRGVWDNVMLRWFGWFGALQDRCQQIHDASLTGLERHLEDTAKAGPAKAAAAGSSETPK